MTYYITKPCTPGGGPCDNGCTAGMTAQEWRGHPPERFWTSTLFRGAAEGEIRQQVKEIQEVNR